MKEVRVSIANDDPAAFLHAAKAVGLAATSWVSLGVEPGGPIEKGLTAVFGFETDVEYIRIQRFVERRLWSLGEKAAYVFTAGGHAELWPAMVERRLTVRREGRA